MGTCTHCCCKSKLVQPLWGKSVVVLCIISGLANCKSLQMGQPASYLAPLAYSQTNSKKDPVKLFMSDHAIPCSLQPHYPHFCSSGSLNLLFPLPRFACYISPRYIACSLTSFRFLLNYCLLSKAFRR